MNKSKTIKAVVIFIITAFLYSCDFTPRFYKDIIKAQESLIAQDYEQAIKIYKSILEENPSPDIKVKIYYQLGELYSLHLLNNKEGLKYYSKIKKFYQDPLWLVRTEQKIADIYFSYEKDYVKSAESYKKLAEFVPKLKNVDNYQLRLGISYLNSNQLDKSLIVFDQISKKRNHKHHVKSLYYTGLLYFKQKKWLKAIAFWNEYIKYETKKDDIIKTKFMMANAYETAEKLKEAYNLYYSILGEYPNTAVIKSRLNTIYERKVSRKR